MAPVLTSEASAQETRLWAIDKLILAYFGCCMILILGWWSQIQYASALFASHLAGAAVVVYQVRRPNRTTWFFRHWYPLLYVAACYKETALFIPAIRHTELDGWLAKLDFSIWGANPTVALERIQSPVLTEYLQWVYTLFVPMVLLPAFLLWRRRRYAEFQYFAFLVALGYLISYVGYLMVPARGPRFLLARLQHIPLQGLWLFDGMQRVLDHLESVHYDCFPSGHTELTILAWWSTRPFGPRLFWLSFAYTLSIIFATVYLRYHYTVDLLAGVVVAAILLAATPAIYQKWK
ncbi:MAG: phosphatase PAP2 family protein [Acidobacteriota bacterium]|nr:phosphatase PAP2 family protein [Acidobacteriota bacterium]